MPPKETIFLFVILMSLNTINGVISNIDADANPGNYAFMMNDKVIKQPKNEHKCDTLCQYLNRILKKYKIGKFDNKVLKGYSSSSNSKETAADESIDLEVNFYGKQNKKEEKGLIQLISE